MTVSGTTESWKNAKKGTRSRLEVSPVITRRRQWDWIRQRQERAWNTSVANERDIRVTAMLTAEGAVAVILVERRHELKS